MQSTVRAGLAAMLMTFALAAPVLAVKPLGSCPNDGFDAMNLNEFIALELSLGLPPDLVPAYSAAWASLDRNGDGALCIKDVPDTPGHTGAIYYNAVDNTSHSN
jgi:hypothetical protein